MPWRIMWKHALSFITILMNCPRSQYCDKSNCSTQNAKIVLTDSIDGTKRFLGVGDALRDVLTIVRAPIEWVGLNIIN